MLRLQAPLPEQYTTASPDELAERIAAAKQTLGERLFIDYRGQTVTVIDPTTGEARQAQIFVAVLGASNPTSAIRTLRGPICMGFARQNAHKWLIVRRRALQKAL